MVEIEFEVGVEIVTADEMDRKGVWRVGGAVFEGENVSAVAKIEGDKITKNEGGSPRDAPYPKGMSSSRLGDLVGCSVIEVEQGLAVGAAVNDELCGGDGPGGVVLVEFWCAVEEWVLGA